MKKAFLFFILLVLPILYYSYQTITIEDHVSNCSTEANFILPYPLSDVRKAVVRNKLMTKVVEASGSCKVVSDTFNKANLKLRNGLTLNYKGRVAVLYLNGDLQGETLEFDYTAIINRNSIIIKNFLDKSKNPNIIIQKIEKEYQFSEVNKNETTVLVKLELEAKKRIPSTFNELMDRKVKESAELEIEQTRVGILSEMSKVNFLSEE